MSSVDEAQNNISFYLSVLLPQKSNTYVISDYSLIQKMILARMPRKERKER